MRLPYPTKDAGLRLRVEREIRQEFVDACRGEGKTAAQVLREYMRDYIVRNRAAAQQELFLPAVPSLPVERGRVGPLTSLRRTKSRARHPE